MVKSVGKLFREECLRSFPSQIAAGEALPCQGQKGGSEFSEEAQYNKNQVQKNKRKMMLFV